MAQPFCQLEEVRKELTSEAFRCAVFSVWSIVYRKKKKRDGCTIVTEERLPKEGQQGSVSQVEETNDLRCMDKDVLKVWHGWNSHRGGCKLTKQVPGWSLQTGQKRMISRAQIERSKRGETNIKKFDT